MHMKYLLICNTQRYYLAQRVEFISPFNPRSNEVELLNAYEYV